MRVINVQFLLPRQVRDHTLLFDPDCTKLLGSRMEAWIHGHDTLEISKILIRHKWKTLLRSSVAAGSFPQAERQLLAVHKTLLFMLQAFLLLLFYLSEFSRAAAKILTTWLSGYHSEQHSLKQACTVP